MKILFTILTSLVLVGANVAQGSNSLKDSSCPVHQDQYPASVSLPDYTDGFMEVTNGTIYYRLFENEKERPLLILAPGLPSSIYYSQLIKQLSSFGYNILSFDYAGKMNSKLKSKSNLNTMMVQISDLLLQLDLKRFTIWHIVGTSMGGVIAAQLALEHSTHVGKLVLLSPVGLKHPWTFTERMAKIPILSKILAPFILKKQVKKNIEKALICPQNYTELIREQDQYLATWTSRWNYLNIISNFAMKDETAVYRKLEHQGLDILVTSGEKRLDKLHNHIEQLKNILPSATYVEIPSTSHIPFIENLEFTTNLMLDFLEEEDPLHEKY